MAIDAPFGDTLPNGSQALECAKLRKDEWVVLADSHPTSPVQPYVTWNADAAGNVYWGHYFTHLSDAAEDFTVRAARGY